MKIKHILIVFLIGVIITIGAAVFKILHYTVASQFLVVGMGLQALSGLLAIWKLITSNATNSFLNK